MITGTVPVKVPEKLSELELDAGGKRIDNLGLGDTPDDAMRRSEKTGLFSDLTDRWTLAQAHRGVLDKIMVFKGPAADPVEEDKPVGIPSGLIAMWHGLIANIPSGYIICDGNNGTPNLLARFVESVPNAATDPGATGGATSKTTGGHRHSGPSHQHTTPAHTLAESEIPSHDHNLKGSDSPSTGDYVTFCSSTTYTRQTQPTGGGGSHAHGNTGTGGTQNTGSKTDSISDIRPKYYDVAFIMKT